jgi:hypothetical protein
VKVVQWREAVAFGPSAGQRYQQRNYSEECKIIEKALQIKHDELDLVSLIWF